MVATTCGGRAKLLASEFLAGEGNGHWNVSFHQARGEMPGARREPLIRATLSQATALTNLPTAKVQHVSTPPRQPALLPAILHPHAASSSHAASLRRAARRWHLQVVATISHLCRGQTLRSVSSTYCAPTQALQLSQRTG